MTVYPGANTYPQAALPTFTAGGAVSTLDTTPRSSTTGTTGRTTVEVIR